jgi:hypothetical protein
MLQIVCWAIPSISFQMGKWTPLNFCTNDAQRVDSHEAGAEILERANHADASEQAEVRSEPEATSVGNVDSYPTKFSIASS